MGDPTAGANAIAIGNRAVASGADSIAIGGNAGAPTTATGANSIAIGSGVQAAAPNEVVIGNAANNYRLTGLGGVAPPPAAATGDRIVVSDAAGNLSTRTFSLAATPEITNINNQINNINNEISNVNNRLGDVERHSRETRREARQGIAAAMALATSPMPTMVGRTTWAVNGSTFNGEFGAGLSIAHRLNFAVPVAFTAGVAVGGGEQIGGRIGLMGEF